MIRIHDIRLVSDSVAEADVAWGDNLERRDWFRFESRVDDHLGVPVDKPSVPHEFSVYFAQWLWTISVAIDRVRRGEPIAFPLDVTSCRKPGAPEKTEREVAAAERWRKIRDLQGRLFVSVAEDDRARVIAEIEQLQRELDALDP